MASATQLATTTVALVGEAGQVLSTALTLPEAEQHKTESASILDEPHLSPVRYNPSDPIVLFCVQAGIIILLTRFLAVFLGKLRQPKVISEVIGGILLGPSVCGRIPGFTENIFPAPSLPYLNLVATIGLVLFLFLVGLESDFAVFKRNARSSISIAVSSLVIPFGLGAAVSVGLFDKFVRDDANNVSFGHFLLFVAVAMAITAFPVLSRILTELNLLKTDVGACVLAAGVANDVCGWILLALAIALVNATSGVSAVYVLLCAVGWILVLIFIARPLLYWAGRKTGSFENGPSNLMMVVTILLTFTSAFVTSIIGIHPIFGGFCAGVVMPQRKRFVQQLTEKVEDLVSVLFLPIYFALSGLRTNLGLLNDGSIWGYAVCVIVVAFASKFFSSGAAAKWTGFNWRESAAVGSLMACKGLVELIVLNIGLDAGILNDQIFAMFVLMALVTTFATTPLVLLFYSPRHRVSPPAVSSKDRELIRSTKSDEGILPASMAETQEPSANAYAFKRFVVVLNRFEHLPSIMAMTKLLHKPLDYQSDEKMVTSRDVHIDALRLLELTERTSAVQRAANLEETAAHDPLRNVYATFAGLNGFDVNPAIFVAPYSDFSSIVVSFVLEKQADMVILPWGSLHQPPMDAFESGEASSPSLPTASSPFNAFFRSPTSPTPGIADRPLHAAFVRHVLDEATCDVGLFLDRSSFGSAPAIPAGRQHIFLPFMGGPDDRLALALLVQLCQHPGVTATAVFIQCQSNAARHPQDSPPSSLEAPSRGDVSDKQMRKASLWGSQSDYALWSSLFGEGSSSSPTGGKAQALGRITSRQVQTTPNTSLAEVLNQMKETIDQQQLAPVMVMVGRSPTPWAEQQQRMEFDQRLKEHVAEHGPKSLGLVSDSSVRKTMGELGSFIVVSGLAGSLLVLQAGQPGSTKRSRKSSFVV